MRCRKEQGMIKMVNTINDLNEMIKQSKINKVNIFKYQLHSKFKLHFENKSYKNIPFTVDLKKIKFLGMNIMKSVQNILIEYYKI